MLSIGKLVAGAEEYYLGMVAHGREEYYTGAGESPGTWLGTGRESLGLDGRVAPDDLHKLLAGISPRTGTALGVARANPVGRVAGFDLTFSAPKSVSLLYGLSAPATAAAVRDAHDRAVAEGLAYLEGHAVFARRGAGGESRMATAGLVAAGFVHRTSRAGDPQLHSHVLVANAVLGDDGRWSAPDARLLYFHARTAGFVYHASLRAGLVESLGARFGPAQLGSAELDGIDPGLLRGFSTRRAEIEEYLFARGESSRRTAELAALATRAPKTFDADADGVADGNVRDLRDKWRAQAVERGFDPDTLCTAMGRPRQAPSPQSSRHLAEHLLGPEGLTAQESVFERRDVVRAVSERLVDGAYLADLEILVDDVMTRPEVVSFPGSGRGGEALGTTAELLEVEATLLERAERHRSAGATARVDHELSAKILGQHPILSAEQKAMVTQLVTSGAGVEVVVGKAGAGKTTALSLTREIFEAAGFEVTGTALSARAAEELEVSAGIGSTTLARFLGGIDDGIHTLGQSDIVVVDEAGMVGTRTIAQLVALAEQSGAKLVLVGDPRQLPEIDAGGAFGTLAVRLGAIELKENRRQHEPWERLALDQLRAGDVKSALSAYDAHERIHLSATMRDTRAEMVERWLVARVGGSETLMLAVNRRDVAALNDVARDALRANGVLGDDVVQTDDRAFALGDEVLCLRNARRLGVLNGTRGKVVGFDAQGLSIETKDGPRVLPPHYLEKGHLGHGYATTVHKSQGATYDRAFVLATESLTREASYVAMSRARIASELFVVDGPIEVGLGPEIGVEEPLSKVATRMAVSRAKALASSHLCDAGVPLVMSPVEKVFGLTGRPGDEEPRMPLPPDHCATDFSAPAPPLYVITALGSRPGFVDEQVRYDHLADAISKYRERHFVQGNDPLGARPFEAMARLDYDAVVGDIRSYERFRWRELEPQTLETGLER